MTAIRAFFPKSRAPFFQFLKKGRGDHPLSPLITRLLWNPFGEFESLIKVLQAGPANLLEKRLRHSVFL